MQHDEVSVKHLGDKDLVHYYEVALLEQYWGSDRKELITLLETEVRNRGMEPGEIQRPLMERVPDLDAVLQALWTGTQYVKPEAAAGEALHNP